MRAGNSEGNGRNAEKTVQSEGQNLRGQESEGSGVENAGVWPPCCAVIAVRTRPRAIPLAMITMGKSIDQLFRYIKTQPKTIDLSTRLRGITTGFVGFIPRSLMLRSIMLG